MGCLCRCCFGRVSLHLDGGTQGGMQFGVLVLMELYDAVCGELFAVRAHFCDIDARVLSGMQVTVQAHACILTVGCKGGMQLRWWFGILFGVLVDSRKIRVLLGAFFGGVLLEVLVCKRCYLGFTLV